MPTNIARILIGTTCFLLVFFAIAQIPGSQKPQPRPHQQLILSDAQTAPDSQDLPPPPPPAQATIVSIVAPWQGPITPVTIGPQPLPPVFYKLPITAPVVFLGIDDGWFQSPENLQWLKDHHLPFSLFLVDSQIKNDYGYFKQLQNSGMAIEDHSLTHPDFTKLHLPDQQTQICGTADSDVAVFGRRPAFFRPPYGAYNALTQQAAAACGMKALITWHASLSGGAVFFQPPSTHLEPGDIILVHFQSDLIPNMQALNAQLEQDHLQLGRLEDWLR